MAEATSTTIAPPARYGRAYRELIETVNSLTPEQVGDLDRIWTEIAANGNRAYETASARMDQAASIVIDDAGDPGLDGKSIPIIDTALAVLCRDRGLLTQDDFAAITAPWTAAGLPLPVAVTGDEEADPLVAIDVMTSDRLADELLNHTFHDLAAYPTYGAVLLLTGYNHGELLAHEPVRRVLDRHNDGKLMIDWASLRSDLAKGVITDLTDEAHNALCLALDLALMSGGGSANVHLFSPDHPETAEVMTFAIARTLGVPYLLVRGIQRPVQSSPGS